ncbi:MAG TPA: divalent-cation tolerance protein CutA [Nitrospiraceae bacterium]|jgi:periplasmic divalent cation tolerance protein
MSKSSRGVLLVFVTAANRSEALKISERAVRTKLAACGNVLPKIESVFRWKGKIERQQEVLVILKTTVRRYQALERMIKAAHSYQVPEIIAVSVVQGSRPYLDWVRRETTSN